ncbi:MAG TPA: fibronectin type III domain-containing protein [Bacteroidia bacterium]
MKKVKVSVRLYKLLVAAKVEFARGVVIAMTGNTNFTTPSPALSVITSAANSLDNAITAAQDRSRLHISQRKTADGVLDNLLAQLALYVENVSNNDANKILSSGMGVKHSAAASQVPDAPTKLSAVSTTNEGEVELKWHGVPKARVYVIEQSDDVSAVQTQPSTNPAPLSARVFIVWTQTDIITKTKLVVKGLVSGSKYAFRVYVVSAGGKSARTALVVVKVL